MHVEWARVEVTLPANAANESFILQVKAKVTRQERFVVEGLGTRWTGERCIFIFRMLHNVVEFKLEFGCKDVLLRCVANWARIHVSSIREMRELDKLVVVLFSGENLVAVFARVDETLIVLWLGGGLKLKKQKLIRKKSFSRSFKSA